MFRRFLGFVILLATIVVLVALLAFAYYFGPALDAVGQSLDNALVLATESLETVSLTLEQTQASLDAINDSMETAAQTTSTLSIAVADTAPLMKQVDEVVTGRLPDSVRAAQAALGSMVDVAKLIDDAMRRLSAVQFEFTIPIPFNPKEYSFGPFVEYNPTVPFDESISALETSLDGLPEQLESLDEDLAATAQNLETLSQDLEQASGDIEALAKEVEGFSPLLDQYLDLIDQVINGVEQIRVQIADNLATVRLVGTILPFALALTQLAPLVIGWDLLTGKTAPQLIGKEIEELKESMLAAAAESDDIKEQVELPPEEESDDTLILASEDKEPDSEEPDSEENA